MSLREAIEMAVKLIPPPEDYTPEDWADLVLRAACGLCGMPLGDHDDEQLAMCAKTKTLTIMSGAEWDYPLAKELGAICVRHLENGQLVGLTKERHYKVWRGDRFGIEAAFEYPHAAHAYSAVQHWTGEGDPIDGWVRAHPPYHRRRPAGLADEEYVEA